MAASDGFRILGESAGDYSGWGVDGSGDINGDGFSDLLVSAPLALIAHFVSPDTNLESTQLNDHCI